MGTGLELLSSNKSMVPSCYTIRADLESSCQITTTTIDVDKKVPLCLLAWAHDTGTTAHDEAVFLTGYPSIVGIYPIPKFSSLLSNTLSK